MATAGPSTSASKPAEPPTAKTDAPLAKWTCDALKAYLRARGFSFSGMRKEQLIAK